MSTHLSLFPIHDGIPLPKARKPMPETGDGMTRKLRRTLRALKVLQCCDVPLQAFPGQGNVRRLVRFVSSRAAETFGPGAYRVEGLQDFVRCWRAA